MTTPESGPSKPEVPDEELDFGETARARSEAILSRHGKRIETEDGKAWLSYTWKVGWEWWKKFTLSRPDVETVLPDTVYSLEYKDLAGNDDGQYDFSQREGFHESSAVSNRVSKEHLYGQLSGGDAATMHQEELLDFLSSEEKKNTGF